MKKCTTQMLKHIVFFPSSSKKDVAIRKKELLEAVSTPLLTYLCENAQSMVMDKASCVAVSDILGAAIGDLRPAMEAVAALAARPLVPGGKDGQVTNLQVSASVLKIFAVLSVIPVLIFDFGSTIIIIRIHLR